MGVIVGWRLQSYVLNQELPSHSLRMGDVEGGFACLKKMERLRRTETRLIILSSFRTFPRQVPGRFGLDSFWSPVFHIFCRVIGSSQTYVGQYTGKVKLSQDGNSLYSPECP